MQLQNGTMFQYFSWGIEDNGKLWTWLKESADHFRSLGITAVWLPPAYKSDDDVPANRVGYGVYDHYDLGEFGQKTSKNGGHPTRTKYGTKDELHQAIDALHGFGYSDGKPRAYIQAYADIVMNHKFGADELENISVFNIGKVGEGDLYSSWLSQKDDPSKKFRKSIPTRFNFPGRVRDPWKTDSLKFSWNSSHFDATVDGNGQIYMIDGRSLDWQVGLENGKTNFDVLMGADIDYSNGFVKGEMKEWGTWLIAEMGFDGFRIDANKHIKFSFIREWIGHVRQKIKERENGKELFSVCEYLSGNRGELENYLHAIGSPDIDNNNPPAQPISVFDFALRSRFQTASISYNGAYQLHRLQEGTLIENSSSYAVTFVENHDTEEIRDGHHVGEWFKHIAYAYILLRGVGYPCVFYGDFYSNQKEFLELLLRLRRSYGNGPEWYYAIDHLNTKHDAIGWVRPYSSCGSMVVVINNSQGRWHQVRMDSGRSNKEFYHYATISWIDNSRHVIDYSWQRYGNSIYTDDTGWANFNVSPRSVTIWLEEGTSPV